MTIVENLLRYHIATTEKQLEALKKELDAIDEKIDKLHEFRTRTIVTARYISLIVSAISGFATMILTATISYLIQKGNHQ